MKRNHIYNKGVTSAVRRMAMGCLVLFSFVGNAVAQSSNAPTYVIKRDNHYLAHVEIEASMTDSHGNDSTYWYWQVQDVTVFNPNTCLWQSGPNIGYNFYFKDEHYNKYHYLEAPLERSDPNDPTKGQISVSASHPGTQVLNTTQLNYYFWDWDHGVARGVRHMENEGSGGSCPDEYHNTGSQCWEVVWVTYNGSWKMSSNYSYNPTSDYITNPAPRRQVTVDPHEEEVAPTANNQGGAPTLNDFSMAYPSSVQVNGTATPFSYTFTPAYTLYNIEAVNNTYFNIDEEFHYYYSGTDHTTAPHSSTYNNVSQYSYAWTIEGDGAEYLSFSDGTNTHVWNSDIAQPTVYYNTQNNTNSHKLATLTLTVTFTANDNSQVTQTRTATITVLTECQNPEQAAAPVVTYEDVTVSWFATASKYKVWWKKHSDEWSETNTHVVENATSYAIRGLEYGENGTDYDYKVSAYCGNTYLDVPGNLVYTFKTKPQPNALVYGAVFGGGRMADVEGNTEVIVIHTDSIVAIYGGNDIAGTVSGANGSIITLGVNSGDQNATAYNDGNASTKVRVRDVYGGGNGYYAYNGTSFVAASYNTEYDIADDASINAMTQSHQVGDAVWTNNTGGSVHLKNPRIQKTSITVTNNSVVIDSIFGGAKNAILQNTVNDVNITIDGGTIFAVFGGNNFGGSLGYNSTEIITVNNTKTEAKLADYNSKQLGRDFGIGYLFGGGNKVAGYNTQITINGGQCDTVFGGGNAADVSSALVKVECALGAVTPNTNQYGNVFSNAISSCTGTSPNFTLTIDEDNYDWDGTGIYNIRTLFGGNNKANMNGVPTLTLTSGSIGTVYGGGNAGDMLAQTSTTITIPSSYSNANEDVTIKYGTHVVMDKPNVIVDYLYGGCQMSNVYYSTWVEIEDGHVGTVYGGCNISGDVGSTRVNLNASAFNGEDPNPAYQEIYGGTNVIASGGTVYKDVFAGSNGFYHCNDGFRYISGINYGDPQGRYIGMLIPTHNDTRVVIKDNVHVKNNVYAGANLAPVGFTATYVAQYQSYSYNIGLAAVRMSGGTVDGNVFGGSNMASINGSNEVLVSGGTIGKALYGGNDRLGKAGQFSNRILPSSYSVASDGYTSLVEPKVNTYVGVTGHPSITTVYGGGNGKYDYSGNNPNEMQYCDVTDQPIQSNIFVDISINGGGASGGAGHIQNVYGGGDGVSAEGFIKVFLNVKDVADSDGNHVDTIYGGNNMGDLTMVPEIILLNGNVQTVYGGCNSGAMNATGGNTKSFTVNGTLYDNIGSYVRLLNSYPSITGTPPAKVTGAVYGGCRMNGVANNTLVLVEGGTHPADLFGGSDISGTVGGFSRVAVAGGTTGNVYGGGNGNYYYADAHHVYRMDDNTALVASNDEEDPAITAPICANSGADILGGQVGASGNNNNRNVFGGGLGAATSTTGDVEVNINKTGSVATTIYGDVYGGSALGSVNDAASDKTTVNVLDGTLHGDIYGGGLGDADNAAAVYGKVYVNIGAAPVGTATAYTGNATILGDVYGCNNQNGSPQDDVFVNIYQTAHGDTPADNHYPSAPNTGWTVETLDDNAELQTYAIEAVYGGGNLAAYKPAANKSTTVHVYQCNSNTVKYVFGGGNAADVGTASVNANTNVIIDGGRFYQVYGGGNGFSASGNHSDPSASDYNPGANIYGKASTYIYAGLIDEVFGGANQWGSVDVIDLNVSHSDNSCDEVYGKVFGCANEAPYNKDVTTNIDCGVGTIGELYGGSNKAYIGDPSQPNIAGVNVTLNLKGGGPYRYVFAGSKGDLASLATLEDPNHLDKAADIYGNVTLNLYGGTAVNAFGGSDVNGNITGKVTVNVLDIGTCALSVDNIYGASNKTPYQPTYTPDSGPRISPEINVIYIAEGNGHYLGNVFGGGNEATVDAANPTVNIGYDENSMSDLLTSIAPANWTDPENIPNDFPRAYVTHNVFGGGNKAAVNGTSTVNLQQSASYAENIFGGGNEAGVTNTVVNILDGTVATDVYGGCNTEGTVTGTIAVNANGGTVGNDLFGGGKGNATATQGNVTVTIDGGTITHDVYGGSALGQVNDNATDDLTKVWLKSGTVQGNLYGGGMGDAENNTDHWGQVNGRVEVHVNGGSVHDVFGCNNYNEAPEGTVKVYINETTANTMTIGGNVYGGGNVAAYAGTTEVYIQQGTINNKVFGGGNNIAGNNKGVGNANVEMTGGTVLGGIFGGCNTDGDVTGNTEVTLTGGTIGAADTRSSIHGGGYGKLTRVNGNVTVNFGVNNDQLNENLILYGDLYGGSAFGSVNTNASNTTTVNVYSGTITGVGTGIANYGNVFGGGLGQQYDANTGNEAIEAVVNGVVTVNIGSGGSSASSAKGQAVLTHCNVFGCNNQNGSPQDNTTVHIYKTAHDAHNQVDYFESDRTYAIYQVFGGGNEANYAPENDNDNSDKRAKVHIHFCDNTVQYVYGGSNAADAVGVITIVEGGRFSEIYGGGNGRVKKADIGLGGIGLRVLAGNVGFLFEGSNKNGTNYGHYNDPLPEASTDCPGGLFVDSYFFGTNEAELYGNLDNTIICGGEEPFEYRYVYAGCRWGIVYGDIKLRVCGGTIENLFGGCRGYEDYDADVRRFPTFEELAADDLLSDEDRKYSQELRDYMGYTGGTGDTEPVYAGHGGNVTLIINGGTIGNIYGGCDFRGNVEGNISVIVDDDDPVNPSCHLFVGNVYGASNQWYYYPEHSDIVSPQVRILEGEIGGTHADLPVNNIYGADPTEYAGNVFGGGNRGNVISNPIVIVGDGTEGDEAPRVNILGNVYGGGNEGDVTGNTKVVIVPEQKHGLTSSAEGGGSVTVTNSQGTSLSGDISIGEGVDVFLAATPNDGKAFDHWTVVSGAGSSILDEKAPTTSFTMGTEDASVKATFVEAYTVSITTSEHGTFKVLNNIHQALGDQALVGEGKTVTLRATPGNGYVFDHWTVTGGTVVDPHSATTNFTITGNATIEAHFTVAP